MKYYDRAATWVRNNQKASAAIGLLGTAAVAAGAYYGLPPEVSGPVLKTVCETLTLCPRL